MSLKRNSREASRHPRASQQPRPDRARKRQPLPVRQPPATSRPSAPAPAAGHIQTERASASRHPRASHRPRPDRAHKRQPSPTRQPPATSRPSAQAPAPTKPRRRSRRPPRWKSTQKIPIHPGDPCPDHPPPCRQTPHPSPLKPIPPLPFSARGTNWREGVIDSVMQQPKIGSTSYYYIGGVSASSAKGVGCDKRRPGSNPGFSAQSVFREESGFLVVYDVVFWAAGFCHTPPVKSKAVCEMRSAEFVDQCFLKDS